MSFLSSVFGGSAPKAQQVWQPSWKSGADTQYQNAMQDYYSSNPYSTYTPQATATFNNAYNNPYAAGMQTAANNAGAGATNIGNLDLSNAQAIGGTVPGTISAAQQVLNMGMDPRGDLYRMLAQQTADKANVQNYQSGVGNTPYGASVANNANTNFNMSWQEQQLQRAIQGLQGYDAGIAGAGAAGTQASNLGSTGAGLIQQGGALPYQAANTITNDQNTALTNLLAILQGKGTYDLGGTSSLLDYLGLGAQQSNQQAANNAAAMKTSQSGIGSLLGAVAPYALAAATGGTSLAALPAIEALPSLGGTAAGNDQLLGYINS